MQRYLARRLLQGIGVLAILIVIVFVVGRALGNPLDLMLPVDATAADREHMARALGLDQPMPVQFLNYLGGAVKGDFGNSVRFSQPATALFLDRLPNSLKLVALAWVFAFVVGLPIAVTAAVHKDGWVDAIAKLLALGGMAMPSFLVALLLIQAFSLRFRILPVAGMDSPANFVLPVITLGFHQVAGLVRLLRSDMLDVLDADFTKLARIKGVSERRVVWWHCLRNALATTISFAGVQIAALITGAIVIETVFAWPGTGRLAYEAIMFRDYPLIQTVVILGAAMILLLNFAVDVVYAYLDPRIRYA